jgi:hypothetical protein
MILDELDIVSPPDDRWLARLRRNHFVWAVKEKRFAKIEWAWEPPNPGCIAGHLGVRFCWRNEDDWGLEHCQTWFIKPGGRGLDGKYLLHPVKGNCPVESLPISEPWQRQTERTLGQMAHRIEQLESLLRDCIIVRKAR